MEIRSVVDVSVLTANYNNGRYIGELIKSVVTSTVLPIQFIIVDDGSTDDSVDIIKEYSEQYNFIELVRLPENKGFANALNAGLVYVTGRFVLRVDADDYITADRIEKQYRFLEKNEHIGVLGSNIRYFDSVSGKELFSSHVSIDSYFIKKDFLNVACGVIHGSTLIRTSIFQQYTYVQDSVPAEDYEIFSKMLKDGVEIQNLSDVLTYVRVHVNSVSNSLPYRTIQKTYQIARKVWGIEYSDWRIKFKYFHLKYYRRFLFESDKIKKVYYILLSSFFCPNKVIKRLFK